MAVDENRSKQVSVYGGTKYFFCCTSCKATFDANPLAYVKA
jgi:YHS domain-containing protein